MSTGFSCNLGYPIPKNWAFDQFYEMTFPSSPSFGIDKDGYSGRDSGCSNFDNVESKSSEELIIENHNKKIRAAREKFTYNVLSPLGSYYDKLADYGFKIGKEIPVQHMESDTLSMDVSVELQYEENETTGKAILVSIDNEGKLSASCENQISEMVAEAASKGVSNASDFKDVLESIALSIKTGKINYQIKVKADGSIVIGIEAVSPDIFPDDDTVEAIMSVSINYKITIKPNSKYHLQPEEAIALSAILVAAIVVACGTSAGVAAPGIPAVLEKIGELLAEGGVIAAVSAS